MSCALPRPRVSIAAALGLIAIVAVVAAAGAGDGVGAMRLLMLLVFAPLAEEAVFRAGLQEALLRHGQAPWLSNLLTALVFAAAHVLVRNDLSALLIALPALLIGASYARTRQLRACVLLHAALNASWLAWTLWA